MQNFIRIHERDNVVVALRNIAAGETILMPAGGETAPFTKPEEEASADSRPPLDQKITALEEIPAGHKMAICNIPAGGQVIKYGYCIGNAKEQIPSGAWVHTHNLGTALGDLLEYEYRPVFETRENAAAKEQGAGRSAGKGPDSKEETAQMFRGFRRPDGKVGVRNEVWIIPTVGCVNNVATAIARQANDWLAEFWRTMPVSGDSVSSGEGCAHTFEPGHETGIGGQDRCTVEEVIAFPHPYGCSQMGEDQEYTRKILTNLVKHPNAGGVLVLGLGCENSNIEVLKPYIGDYDQERVKFLVSQECEDEVAQGLEIVKALIQYAARFQREPISASELVIGMKCGGSDGLSGITANPLVGRFSDRLIEEGGTTILTEVPEMFGAETILMNRCANEELFQQTVALINDFKNYFKSHGQTIYENPSPGNKKGGISTLEDKSLGCTQKSGSALVQGVLPYGGVVERRGLNLLSAPGNDLVAATALAAAGAHIVLFTTGRGTPFASPVPTVKIATNSSLAGRKANWIDFNAGVLVKDGNMEAETERLFDYVVEVASGRKVCSEEAGYHDMAIFKRGVTL